MANQIASYVPYPPFPIQDYGYGSWGGPLGTAACDTGGVVSDCYGSYTVLSRLLLVPAVW